MVSWTFVVNVVLVLIRLFALAFYWPPTDALHYLILSFPF